ncbi:PASTA domain-containing protein [Yinghuangia sp. ASG 101]|uniref:PASTA domain-containing protein n=1 Tax=Yinghuangia sp. ASG 101 TaxID=2896848 RepID=UPI001E4C9BC0|nr:PASTA domain-containing protein [Yinghuangia sp. ASG 101]UGQ13996.1 PASTA domain-containing protein [Yinghuangia sp. ASG 101]
MRHFCRLCGTRADGKERLGTYCPGNRCGADLVSGHRAGVQAWCDPERRRAEPRAAVTVRLVVRNAGARPDTFRVEPVERVYGNLDFDASVLNVPLAPGQTRVVDVRYTLPHDHTRLGVDVASRFGVPGADATGRVDDGRVRRFGVALRVVSTTANQGAAAAAFAVDVPRGPAPGGVGGGARGRSLPLVVGGALLALIVVAAAVVAFVADGGDTATAAPGAATPGQARVSVGADPTGARAAGDEPPDGSEESTATGAGMRPVADPSVTVRGTETTVVPDTVTLDRDAAERALRARGLVARVVVRENSRGPEGEVLASSPAAGETVRAGSTVTLTVRDGTTTVPDVIGTDQKSAEAAVHTAGAHVTVKFRPTPNDDEYGIVVATSPTAGTRVPVTSTVTIYIGGDRG